MLANLPRIVVALSLLLLLVGNISAQTEMINGESCTNTLTQPPHTHSDGCEDVTTTSAAPAVTGGTVTVQGPTYTIYTTAQILTILTTVPTATQYVTITQPSTVSSRLPVVETVTVPVAHTITTLASVTIETAVGSPTPTITETTVITSLETIVTQVPSTIVTTVVPSATTVPLVETITTLETITALTTLGIPPTATVLTTYTTLATITTTIASFETITTYETLTLLITLGTPTPTQTLTTTITNLVTVTVPAPAVRTITTLETITAYTTISGSTPTTALTTITTLETLTTAVPVTEAITTLETITLLLTLGSPTPTLTTATTITTLVTLTVHATPEANSTVPLNFQNNIPSDYGHVPVPTPVQNASTEYIRLFGDGFLYYEAERSGYLPADNRISWRNNSGLNDGSDNHVDLVGGYYDAGGYLKFTFPLSFTLSILSWGSVEYIQAYVTANQTEYLRSMIQWGTTWLIKAHASVDTLYVQVGNVTLDESYSGPDTGIPTPRPSYFVNSTHTGTDVVAEAAAAFASASVLFTVLGNVTQNSNDTAYAALLLTHAEQLFDFAVNAKPYNMYQTSDTALNGKYISTGYTDELFWASVHLYRATKNVTYLDTARQFYTSFNLSGSTRAVNWDWKTGAAYVLMAELTYGDVVTGLQATNDSASWQLIAEQFLDSITNVTEQVSTQGAYLTQGGLWWYNGESEGNSLSISMTQSMLLFLYSSSVLRRISGSSQQGSAAIRAARYETFAQTQIDYMLGLNPSEVMFMAGERPNSPQNLDSSLLGSEVISSNVTLPPKRLFVLKGALVSGPNNLDSFDDNSSDANSTLVGLQYNAPLQVLLARQVIYSTKNPFYIALTNTNSSTPAGATLTSSNNGFPVWAIVLIVVLGVLLLLALLLCLFCCMRRRNRAAAAGAPTNQASIGTATAAAAGPDRAMAAPEMTEVVVAEEDTALANTAPSGGAFEVTTEELDEVEIPVFAGSDEAPTNESGFAVESEELEDATAAAAAAAAAQAAESKKKGGWLFGKKKAAKDEVHGFPVETTSLTAGAVGSEAEVEEVDIDDVEINGPVDEIAIAGAATTSAANIGINKDAAAATGVFGGAAREEKVEIDEVDTITTKKVGFAGAAAAAAAALVGRGKGAAGAKEIEIDETDVTTIREVELGTGGRKGFRGAGAEEVEIDEVDVTTTKIDELSGVGVGGLAGGAVSKKGFSATRGGGKEVVITEVDISPKGKLTRTKTETETVSDGPGKLTRTTTTITTTTSGKK